MRNRIAATSAIVIALSVCMFAVPVCALADQPPGRPERVIKLVERIHDLSFQDNGPAGPSLGDRVIFTSDLFDRDDNLVGKDGADCVIVRIDPSAPPANQQTVQCVITVQLQEGQITFQALAEGTENTFAITGGTGAFRFARGEAVARDIVPFVLAEITINVSNAN